MQFSFLDAVNNILSVVHTFSRIDANEECWKHNIIIGGIWEILVKIAHSGLLEGGGEEKLHRILERKNIDGNMYKKQE